jgi:hypothetical protein
MSDMTLIPVRVGTDPLRIGAIRPRRARQELYTQFVVSGIGAFPVDIDFCGEIVKLDCRPEDEDYARYLVEHLRRVAAENGSSDPTVSRIDLIFLVAMSLADELYGAGYAHPDRRTDGAPAADEREALQDIFRQF